MARDGSGTFTLPEAAFVFNTIIDEAAVNANFSAIATALTESLARDGQTDPTANLPMAGFRHTGVGNASARTDYAAAGQVQDSAFTWCGTAGGTADALTVNPSPAVAAYAAGQAFRFIAAADNTGAATVAVSGQAAKAIQLNGSALGAGDIASGKIYEIVYDGTQFQVQQISMNTLAPAAIDASGFITGSPSITPVGSVIDYAGTTAPTGWLFCYGQNVSRTTYAALFTAIGTTYGAGDGSTTFTLPDLRGRVVAGKDDMGGVSANRLTDQSGGLNGDTLGDTGGAETHTLTVAQMPAHSHTYTTFPNTDNTNNGGDFTARRSDSATASTSSVGGDGAHNNVQPTIILNKIIYAGAA